MAGILKILIAAESALHTSKDVTLSYVDSPDDLPRGDTDQHRALKQVQEAIAFLSKTDPDDVLYEILREDVGDQRIDGVVQKVRHAGVEVRWRGTPDAMREADQARLIAVMALTMQSAKDALQYTNYSPDALAAALSSLTLTLQMEADHWQKYARIAAPAPSPNRNEVADRCRAKADNLSRQGNYWVAELLLEAANALEALPSPDAAAEPDDDWEARSERSYIDNTKAPPPDDVRSALAEALEKSDWSNTPIGNKVLIRNAIDTLRSAPVSAPATSMRIALVDARPYVESAYEKSHHAYDKAALEQIDDALCAPAVGVTREAIELANRAEGCLNSRNSAYPSDVLRECIAFLRHLSPAPDAPVSEPRYAIEGDYIIDAKFRRTVALFELINGQPVEMQAIINAANAVLAAPARDAVIEEVWCCFNSYVDAHMMPIKAIKAVIRSLQGAKP